MSKKEKLPAKNKKFQANQYQSDPRQLEFLALYLNPQSDTYSNALESALKAGFSQEYAETITYQMPKWLSENLGKRQRMLQKAENNLETILDYDDIDGGKRKIKADITKFVAERLGKKWYGQEKGTTAIQVNIQSDRDKYE